MFENGVILEFCEWLLPKAQRTTATVQKLLPGIYTVQGHYDQHLSVPKNNQNDQKTKYNHDTLITSDFRHFCQKKTTRSGYIVQIYKELFNSVTMSYIRAIQTTFIYSLVHQKHLTV